MAASGFTPIQLYRTTTAAAVPVNTNLADGELAINTTDEKLFFKNAAGTVKVIAGTGGAGVVAGSNTQVQFNNSGVFGASSNLTFNGTILTAAGLSGPLNGTVGATTASTGAFSTLSATGVTTVQAGSAAAPAITTTGDTNTGIYFPAADTIAFSEGGVEAMRIDSSGNLLVGTGTNGTGRLQVTDSVNYTFEVKSGGSGISTIGGTSGTTQLAFQTNGSEGMRLTSTGLGIGTTTPGVKLDVNGVMRSTTWSINGTGVTGGTAAFAAGTVSTDSNWGMYFRAPTSSSALAAYSFRNAADTELIRITSAGNVGIGTSSPTSKLSFGATIGLDFAVFENSGGANKYGIGMGGAGTGGDPFRTKLYANGVEYLSIDSAGGVGIGTVAPATKLHVAGGSLTMGAFGGEGGEIQLHNTTGGSGVGLDVDGSNNFRVFNVSNTSTVFYTNSAERMRINSSGNLLVGTTTNNGEKVRFSLGSVSPATSGNMTTGAIFQGGDGDRALNLATDASGVWYNSGFANNAGVAGVHRWLVGGTERLSLSTAGIVTMSAYGAGAATFSAAGVISSVSDETWKTKDGVPVDTDAMLKKLEPGYWYYNDEKKETFGADRQLGFYAQNVNAAIGPEAAPTPEEGKPWGYYDRSVLAVVVMSLQKALATIESLEARIATLESKP